MENLKQKNWRLFWKASCSPPVSRWMWGRLAFALELDRETTEQLLQHLADYYAYERRGMRLIRMDDAYQLISAPGIRRSDPPGL